MNNNSYLDPLSFSLKQDLLVPLVVCLGFPLSPPPHLLLCLIPTPGGLLLPVPLLFELTTARVGRSRVILEDN